VRLALLAFVFILSLVDVLLGLGHFPERRCGSGTVHSPGSFVENMQYLLSPMVMLLPISEVEAKQPRQLGIKVLDLVADQS
jgi:hypothetical protein